MKTNNVLNILLVEDVSADAELIQHVLRKSGLDFTVRCVQSKKAFLKELRGAPPDVIISDFSMPQFNALDALHLLKSHRVNLPFILVTGSQSEETAVQCIHEGADDYILKSSLTRLPTSLKSVLTKHQAEQDREKAEAALRESEEHFRTLIENSSDIISILAHDGTILYTSPSTERVFGHSILDLIGRPMIGLIHENDRTIFERTIREVIEREGADAHVEFRFQHQDGSWRFVETVAKNLVRKAPFSGVVLNSREITTRKAAEEQIREQAALLNKAQDAIMVVDLENRVSFWNRGAERVFGWDARDATGKIIGDFIFSPAQAPPDCARIQTLEKGEWHGEMAQIARDGRELVMESSWSLIRELEGRPKGILIIATDITEKKRLEAHVLRSQRMESIGSLAGGIAHDLNNVLTPILMAVKLLRDEVSEGSGQNLIDTLEASAHRGAAIVQQVLSFARGSENERSILQVKHPLGEVIKICKETFPPFIHLRTRIEKDLWPIRGDPTQLHQVFMNLCVNAKDAMPHGGRLQIEAENTSVDENYARMQPDATPGSYVVVTVSDTGIGVPPALLNKIFEPFFTTKEAGKGTGLGLSTSAAIVKNHGGFLNVYSERGNGSCFKVHLPAAAGALETPIARKVTAESPAGSGELVMVVDDESAIREIIKVTLQNNGYKVLTANDGTEAVALFAQHRYRIDLIVMDIMMPYMDGPATMRAVQKLDPTARFVAVSGLMDDDKVSEMSDLGNVVFLAKPFTTEQILSTIHTMLKKPLEDRSTV
jgi:two-component system cell cycle sensor histidine kinase/response regulator CckA